MSLPLRATVIGPDALAEALHAQGAAVDRREPPADLPDRLLGDLVIAFADDAISDANDAVTEHLLTTRPVITGTSPAGLVTGPGAPRWLLVGGEPRPWEERPEVVRVAAAATCVLEGWADDVADGIRRIGDGEVVLAPAADHGAAVPAAMAVGPSTPCWLTRDDATGREALAPIVHGASTALWLGDTGRDALRAERVLAETLAPGLNVALRITGPLDVLAMAEQAWAMGDDGPIRGRALSLLTLARLLAPLAARAPAAVAAAGELIPGDGFGVSMLTAAAGATLAGLGHHGPSSIVTAVSGDATTVAVQIAGLPGRWFRVHVPPSLDGRGQPLATPGDLSRLMVYGLGAAGDDHGPVATSRSRRFAEGDVGIPFGIDIRAALEAEVAPALRLHGFPADGGPWSPHEIRLNRDVQSAALTALLGSLTPPGSADEPARTE